MISDLFISRPRLAGVISVVLILAGALAVFSLPITQYPDVAPPQVTVSANYPGASAEDVAKAVGAPLEDAINGVENMLYMSSTSTDAGSYSVTITFAIGTDPDIDQVNVSNRVQLATAQLPEAVSRQGVTVRSESPNFLLALAFYTTKPDALTPIQAGAYLSTNVAPALSRVQGVGNAAVIGSSDYAMRIWTDPERMSALDISPQDVSAAIQTANVQGSVGSVGASPAPKGQSTVFSVTAQGRFTDPEQFRNIIVRAEPNGGIIRVGDIARVELGAESYAVEASYEGKQPAQLVQVNQSPGANALQTVKAVKDELDTLAQRFPDGLEYGVIYDATAYVRVTIEEIVFSLSLVAAIVVAVVFIFLQDWRATLVPALSIPVSLVGTFTFLLAFGFSINVITLLALILAIGLVVDDAILVVENCQRVMTEREIDSREAARVAMGEVTGPIISTTLVLLAVFVPTTFLPGLSGRLFQQFGVTLSIALLLSAIVALTLTPALAAILLKPPSAHWLPLRLFSAGLAKVTQGYSRVVGFLVRRVIIAIGVIVACFAVAAFCFVSLPSELIPDEDQGAILFDVSLPDSASLQRTQDVMQQIAKIIDTTEGVNSYVLAAGYSLLQSAERPSGGNRHHRHEALGRASRSVQDPRGDIGALFPDSRRADRGLSAASDSGHRAGRRFQLRTPRAN